MIKPLLSCLGFCLLGVSAQAQWVYQPIGFASVESVPFYLDAVDANVAWTVGSGLFSSSYLAPQLARTVNAGQTWTVTNLPVQPSLREDVTALAAVSPTTAWVTTVEVDGARGHIYRTVDGGVSWTTQSNTAVFGNADSYPKLVRFFSATEGVALGENLTSGGGFETYTTADAGLTWMRVSNMPATLTQEDVGLFAPAVVGNNIWFATSSGRVFRSANKGQTWAVATVAPGLFDPTSLAFRNAQDGLLNVFDDGGTNHLLYRTFDGGATWAQVNYSGPLGGLGLSAVPGTNQYVSVSSDLDFGGQGSSVSRDNGLTWTALESTLNHLVVEFLSPTVGWSGGIQILSGNLAGSGANRFSSSLLSTRADAALQASLSVSPNPALGGRFTLQASRPASGPTMVRVLDATGRVVRQQPWASATPLALDLSREPAGLYVLEVQAASGTARQKVVVQ